MERLSRSDGVRLMRLWGVTNWPDVEADYWLWGGFGVFALIPSDGFTDIHMAMRKDMRHHCRNALYDAVSILKSGGGCVARALIEVQYKHACNVASKVGFEHCGVRVGRRLDGTITEVIEMRMKL